MVTICRLPTHGNNCYGTNPNFTETQSYGIFQILSVTNNKKEGNDTVNKEFCFKNPLTVSIADKMTIIKILANYIFLKLKDPILIFFSILS